MAETKERHRTAHKATPKPDIKASAPRTASNRRSEVSADEIRRLIAEAAYYRAKERGFVPGHELDDWVEAESEVMGRTNGQSN